jgi:dTDP-4-amino-4,6-dideoxygalactose transaminase
MANANDSTDFGSFKEATSAPLLDVGRGNAPLKAEIMELFSEIYDSGWFIGGPHVKQLEESVAQATGAKFAVGCASGSDAILLSLMASDIQSGDRVICPSFTFFATASAIRRLGAEPVFVDIDPQTYNLDVEQVKLAITPKTKAIIPVHLFGQCADMAPIMELATRFNIRVIEDCAQSIGATYHRQGSGSIGDIGCFSFYPTKNLGGMGDGGIMTTNDRDIADRLRLLANHGMKPRYYHQVIGINSRLDAMQAAVLNVKMRHLNQYGNDRRQNAENYWQLMKRYGISQMVSAPSVENEGHVWNQYTIRITGGRRDEVRQQLADRNIGSEIYYPIPLHQQECFADLGYEIGSLPITEAAAGEVLSLPIFPELTFAEQQYVVKSLAKIVTQQQQTRRAA